jgi:hypothetical protein
MKQQAVSLIMNKRGVVTKKQELNLFLGDTPLLIILFETKFI